MSTNGVSETAMQISGPVGGGEIITVRDSSALEPRNFEEGLRLAKIVCDSGMFGIKNQADAFVRISTGMGLGLSSVQSLRGIYVIGGKPGLSADLMMALCLQSSDCEFFRMVDSTTDGATFEAKRRRDTKPTRLSFTLEDAKRAQLTGNAMYAKFPAQMLRARCVAALARLVFPEKLHGLYTPEELRSAGNEEVVDATFVDDLAPPARAVIRPKEDKSKIDFLAIASELETTLCLCESHEAIEQASKEYSSKFRGATTEIRTHVKALFDSNRKRISEVLAAAQEPSAAE